MYLVALLGFASLRSRFYDEVVAGSIKSRTIEIAAEIVLLNGTKENLVTELCTYRVNCH